MVKVFQLKETTQKECLSVVFQIFFSTLKTKKLHAILPKASNVKSAIICSSNNYQIPIKKDPFKGIIFRDL